MKVGDRVEYIGHNPSNRGIYGVGVVLAIESEVGYPDATVTAKFSASELTCFAGSLTVIPKPVTMQIEEILGMKS